MHLTSTTAEPANAQQAQAVAQQAAALLNDGGLLVLPTETVYGIAALATHDQAIERLAQLKADARSRGFTVHLPHPDHAQQYVDPADPALRRLLSKLMPGPVTVRVGVDETTRQQKLAELNLTDHPQRIYHDGWVSLRCPDHRLTRDILEQAQGPVVAGSAAVPGSKPAYEAAEAAERLEGQVDLVVDGGRCQYARASTVLRVEGTGRQQRVHVEREGVYDQRTIRRMLRFTILIVCSGNTCRSPMAEGLARHLLATQRNLADDELEQANLRVLSAGAATFAGAPASEHAVQALKTQGIDIAGHRSRELDAELIRQADVIYTMTQAHRQAVLSVAPDAAERTHTLDPDADVPDPIGTGLEDYQQTAAHIERLLTQRLKELEL